jgi:hypothetical protein
MGPLHLVYIVKIQDGQWSLEEKNKPLETHQRRLGKF